DAQREHLFTAAPQPRARDWQIAFAILLCEQRRAGGDATENRNAVVVTTWYVGRRERSRRPAYGPPSLQRALALQRPQMIERRARRDTKRFSDFANGGRQTVCRRELADEVEDLLLPAGQLAHSGRLLSVSRRYSTGVEEVKLLFRQTVMRAPMARTPGTAP